MFIKAAAAVSRTQNVRDAMHFVGHVPHGRDSLLQILLYLTTRPVEKYVSRNKFWLSHVQLLFSFTMLMLLPFGTDMPKRGAPEKKSERPFTTSSTGKCE